MSPGGANRRAALRLRLLAVLALAIFASELFLPPTIAVGGLYIVVVLGSFWWRHTSAFALAAGTASTLTLLSFFLVTQDPTGPALVNRAVILFAVWVTAALGWTRSRTEASLEKSRRTLTVTLESLGDGVITTESGDRVAYLNPVAEALLGWTDAEAKGKGLAEVFRTSAADADDSPGTADEDVLAMRREMKIVTRDGRSIEVEANATSRRAGGGRVVVFRDISERRRERAAIERMAFRDALTDLPNRHSFLDRLELEVEHARRHGTSMALFFLDLDGFKQVNDSLGHDVGDELLRGVSRRLREGRRAGDTVSRLAGDEFTLILPRVRGIENARRLAAETVERLNLPYLIGNEPVLARPSLGIAMYPEDGTTPEELLRRADQAMYEAKRLGGGRAFDWARAQEDSLFPAGTTRDEGTGETTS